MGLAPAVLDRARGRRPRFSCGARSAGSDPTGISGFLGVGVCAFIAYRTGDAKGYFLSVSTRACCTRLCSWSRSWCAGRSWCVAWGYLNGHRNIWKSHKGAVRAYDVATAAWALVFGRGTSSSPSCTTRIRRAGSQLRASAWDGRSPDSYSS
ncbi:DUF3159 domain-containing protein [Rhodococcus hoagii]|nr:DUF3159 domain-containing protein [Prescottella equi]